MQGLHTSLDCLPLRPTVASKWVPSIGTVSAGILAADILTVITFAPVQGFISSSRKLRDLYGSSLLLSYLARAIIQDAEQRLGSDAVVSPALVSTSRGTPNLLVIRGDYRKGHGRDALSMPGLACWTPAAAGWRAPCGSSSVSTGRAPGIKCASTAGSTSMPRAKALLLPVPACGRSSRPATGRRSTGPAKVPPSPATVRCAGRSMGAVIDPRQLPPRQIDEDCQRFAAALREQPQLGEAFIDAREQLSLPELVKRLVTYAPVARGPWLARPWMALLPERYQEIAASQRVVWFMADGDRVGEHLSRLSGGDPAEEAQALSSFSAAMRDWAQQLYAEVPKLMEQKATVIYAGGDDLLGALHDTEPAAHRCRSVLLARHLFEASGRPRPAGRTHRVDGAGVDRRRCPRREALAQLREAERHAKQAGRNRFALRVLFQSGRHLEWICPWALPAPPAGGNGRDRQASGANLSDDIEQLQLAVALDGEHRKCPVACLLHGSLGSAYGPRIGPQDARQMDASHGPRARHPHHCLSHGTPPLSPSDQPGAPWAALWLQRPISLG